MVNAENENGITALDFTSGTRIFDRRKAPTYDEIIALLSAASARGSEGFKSSKIEVPMIK